MMLLVVLYKAVRANITDCIPTLASAVSNGQVPVTEDDLKLLLHMCHLIRPKLLSCDVCATC